MRHILFYLFLLIYYAGLAQNGTPRVNPFEVAGRKVQTTRVQPTQVQPAQAPNTQTVSDTTKKPINTIASTNNLKDSTSMKEDTSSLASADPMKNGNPFEVNHVPLKKKSNVNNPLTEITNIKPKVSNKFMFWIMLFSLPLLALVITAKTSLLSYLIRSVANLNMMKLTKREESNNYFLLILLYIVFLINSSMFIYLLQKYYTGQEGLSIWSWCLLGLLGVYVIRHVSMWLLSKIFPVENEASFYNYVIIVFNIIFGIVIIPVNIVLAYMPEYTKPMIITGIVLFLLFYILRSLRGFSASLFLIGQGLLSFFVYLCTFEIAPILIIIRAVLSFNGKF